MQSEAAYSCIKSADEGYPNTTIAAILGKPSSSVSCNIQLAKVLCEYNPATKRHARGDLFHLYQAQESLNRVQLIPKALMGYLPIKRASHSVVLAFLKNYYMPVGEDVGKGICHPADYIPGSKSIHDDWSKYKPVTRDLSAAGFVACTKSEQVPASKWGMPLFMLWQVRLMAHAFAHNVWGALHTTSKAGSEELEVFEARFPASRKDIVLNEIGAGHLDKTLTERLGLHNAAPTAAQLTKKTGDHYNKFAQVYSEGDTLYGVVSTAKQFDTQCIASFLLLLRWDALSPVVAIQKEATSGTPARPIRGKGDEVFHQVARNKLCKELYMWVMEQLESPDYRPKDANSSNAGGGFDTQDDEYEATCGEAMSSTVHTYDMYTTDLRAYCLEGHEDPAQTDQAKSLKIPALHQRLKNTLGLKTLDGSTASAVRMVVCTSPPFGWNLSSFDKKPANPTEWKVRYARTPYTPPLSHHTSIHVHAHSTVCR